MPSAMEDFTKIEKIGEGNSPLHVTLNSDTLFNIFCFSKALMVLSTRQKTERLNSLWP